MRALPVQEEQLKQKQLKYSTSTEWHKRDAVQSFGMSVTRALNNFWQQAWTS